jgi:hypothetical protein
MNAGHHRRGARIEHAKARRGRGQPLRAIAIDREDRGDADLGGTGGGSA